MAEPTGRQATWVFLSNHAHVLLCISRDRDSRTRDIAEQVGITERAVQRIVADLIAEGYLRRTKNGRRNRYEINRQGHLRSAAFRDVEIGPLFDLLDTSNRARTRGRPPPTQSGEPCGSEVLADRSTVVPSPCGRVIMRPGTAERRAQPNPQPEA